MSVVGLCNPTRWLWCTPVVPVAGVSVFFRVLKLLGFICEFGASYHRIKNKVRLRRFEKKRRLYGTTKTFTRKPKRRREFIVPDRRAAPH